MNSVAQTTKSAIVMSSMEIMTNETMFHQIDRIANLMASGRSTVPKHLQDRPGDCFAVTMQAMQWGMNPFAVAQKTHLVNGILGYEAQLVNAVISSSRAITGRFKYEYGGEWKSDDDKAAWVRVGAVLAGESEITWGEPLFPANVKTKNSPLWKAAPKQQAAYLAVKYWSRMYTPDVILGVYTPDELDAPLPKDMGLAEVVTGQRAEPANAAILPYYESDEAFQADLKKWRAVVAKGKGSMQDALARTKTRFTLTPEQEAEFSVAPAAATMAPKADVQDVQPKAAADPFVVENDICAAETLEQIDVASQSINNVADPVERQRLTDMYQEMRQMLQG